MNRLSKRKKFGLVGLSLLLALGLAHLAVRHVATGPLQKLVERRLTAATGLEISFDSLQAALLPTPHLAARGLRIANPTGQKTPDLLRVDQIRLGVSLWPLLTRTLVIDRLSVEHAELHLDKDTPARIASRAASKRGGEAPDAGSRSPVRIDLRRLEVDDLRVHYRVQPDDTLHSLHVESIRARAKALDDEIRFEISATFDGSKLRLEGEIGAIEDFVAPNRPFPIRIEGQVFEAKVRAEGSVDSPQSLEGLKLDISGEIPELIVADQSFRELGAIQFKGMLLGRDGTLGLESLQVNSSKKATAELDVSGKIDDLGKLEGIEIDARLTAQRFESLRTLLASHMPFSLPDIGSMSASAKLSDAKGPLRLDGKLDGTSADQALRIRATGSADDLKQEARIEIDVDAEAKDVRALTALFPEIPDHEALGPGRAHARIVSRHPGLGLDDLDIRLGSSEKAWVEVQGAIKDVLDLRGVDLEISFGTAGLHHLQSLLARRLPQTSAFEGAAGIRDKDGSLQLAHARLHGGAESPLEIHFDLRFDELPGREKFDVDVALAGEDLRTLGEIVGLDLPPISPVEFSGTIRGSAEQPEVEKLALRIGETRLLGSGSGAFVHPARPRIKARLTSTEVRLQDLGFFRTGDAPDAAAETEPASKTDPHRALPFESLRHVDLDLGIEIDHIGGYAGFDGRNVRVTMELEDGRLDLKEVSAKYQGGQLDAQLLVDAHTPKPKVSMGLQTQGLNLSRIAAQFEENSDYSGLVDADIELAAEGDSIHSLRRSLRGSFALAVRDGNAASKIAKEFVVNLSRSLFMFWKTEEASGIGCGVTTLAIEDGVASAQTFLVRGNQITVTGSGEVDLVKGHYDLALVPKTSDPGILSLAPEVHVKGPLDDPRFVTKKRTLVTSFARGLMQNSLKAGGALLKPFRSNRDAMIEQEKACRARKLESS